MTQASEQDKKNKKRKVLLIFGTRPEAIKMAPVYFAFANDPRFEPLVCSTGQHREMFDQVVNFFNIPIDMDLAIMKPNQTLEWLTSALLEKISGALDEIKPDLVLVQGDTTSTFVGALAAFYKRIPVGHVEAGLRTYNFDAPFPEEMNRQLTGRITDLHFAPTPQSRDNLISEKIPAERVFVTGNTSIDAILDARDKLAGQPAPERPYILITAHRRESFGDRFRQICMAIKQAADEYKDFDFIYPVHLNPNVREPVFELLKGDNIHLTDPAPYPEFVKLQMNSHFIVSDSGGVQEEAPSLGKPVIVIRDTTERPEGVAAGTNILAGTSREGIYKNIKLLMEDKNTYETMARTRNPYGDGSASQQILQIVGDYFSNK